MRSCLFLRIIPIARHRLAVRFVVVMLTAMASYGCSAVPEPAAEMYLDIDDLRLDIGNYWVYETKQALPDGIIATYTDSMVVTSTIQLDSKDAYVLRIYRSDQIIDTMTMSISQLTLSVRDDFFTTEVDTLPCRPVTNRWFDIGMRPPSDSQPLRIDSIIGPLEEVMTRGPQGEQVVSQVERKTVYFALLPFPQQPATLFIMERHELNVISPENTVFDDELAASASIRSVDGRSISWTREHVLGIKESQGITSWLHTSLRNGCSYAPYIQRKLLRTNVSN